VPAKAAGKPLPTVVLVGDSKSLRTANWEWNDEVQFLASRLYRAATAATRHPRLRRGA
jgi:hypothetical protein